MQVMITLSLLLNIAVLLPVTRGIIANAAWVEAAYGPPSPARGIVLAVYLAILAGSALLLWKPLPQMVVALLLVQIAYKLLTPVTVGTLDNPVVLSNLAIAAFHALTLLTIWREIRP
jgi:uncharacterized membrane protein (DUF441 family)